MVPWLPYTGLQYSLPLIMNTGQHRLFSPDYSVIDSQQLDDLVLRDVPDADVEHQRAPKLFFLSTHRRSFNG